MEILCFCTKDKTVCRKTLTFLVYEILSFISEKGMDLCRLWYV